MHNVLGMTSEPPDPRLVSASGERLRRRSIPEYVRTVMKYSIPSFETGNVGQLGGEFVLGPGYVLYSYFVRCDGSIDSFGKPLDCGACSLIGRRRLRTIR